MKTSCFEGADANSLPIAKGGTGKTTQFVTQVWQESRTS
jgi:hypothetical protein